MLNDFISLIFPKICTICEKALFKNENYICSSCLYLLPKTNYHEQEGNPVEKLFYGRANIHSASALYHFSAEGMVQRLIHQLKYKGQKELGYLTGSIYGQQLKNLGKMLEISEVLPVPLHNKKYKKRGYNQSEYFAKGLADSMHLNMHLNCLFRKESGQSQTKKGRYERWKNVEKGFILKNETQLEGKHVLLVDDVITTGATLEACSQVLSEVKDIKISIAAIACATTQ